MKLPLSRFYKQPSRPFPDGTCKSCRQQQEGVVRQLTLAGEHVPAQVCAVQQMLQYRVYLTTSTPLCPQRTNLAPCHKPFPLPTLQRPSPYPYTATDLRRPHFYNWVLNKGHTGAAKPGENSALEAALVAEAKHRAEGHRVRAHWRVLGVRDELFHADGTIDLVEALRAMEDSVEGLKHLEKCREQQVCLFACCRTLQPCPPSAHHPLPHHPPNRKHAGDTWPRSSCSPTTARR